MISFNTIFDYTYESPSLIENYQAAIADKENVWECHHRVETIMNCGAKELKAKGCYENRPAHDLIFLKKTDHKKLHCNRKCGFCDNNGMLGKHHTEESKKKMADRKIGKHHTEESKKKISDKLSGEKNPFYGRHHTEESREKMREKAANREVSEHTRKALKESITGLIFWNNGQRNTRARTSPGPGWKRGRLKQ